MRTFFSLFYLLVLQFFFFSCSESQSIDTAKAPEIKLIDTDFSKGSLSHTQFINLDDIAKFHGHLCDGLVVGYIGLNQALKSYIQVG